MFWQIIAFPALSFLLCFGISFGIMYFYIKWKRREKKRYVFDSTMEPATIRRDYELTATQEYHPQMQNDD